MMIKVVSCRYCSQKHTVKKHGMARSGYQRYFCSECRKTFQVKYIYQAYQMDNEEVA